MSFRSALQSVLNVFVHNEYDPDAAPSPEPEETDSTQDPQYTGEPQYYQPYDPNAYYPPEYYQPPRESLFLRIVRGIGKFIKWTCLSILCLFASLVVISILKPFLGSSGSVTSTDAPKSSVTSSSSTSAPTTSAPSTTKAPETENPASSGSTDEKAAIRAAKSLADSCYFWGEMVNDLIKLGYEKKTAGNAAYNCGVDWIVKGLDYTIVIQRWRHFSRAELLDYLSESGAHSSHAETIADWCGSVWAEEAVYRAASMLQKGECTAENLRSALLSARFTAEESEHGASVAAADPQGSLYPDHDLLPNPTTEQKNAVKKARSYLSLAGYSRAGLIKQLEYEKFTTESAEYAIEYINTNFRMQAARKADTYNQLFSYSRARMIEQLEYEGFTHDEAAYGASAVGLTE